MVHVVIAEYEPGDRVAIMGDVVMETLVGLVIPVYLPKLEVTILAGRGKNQTVRGH